MKRFPSLLLCAALLCGILCGCASPTAKADDPTNQVTPTEPPGANAEPDDQPMDITGENALASTDFALRLFRRSFDGNENAMISPVSVLYALAMTANGARGETLSQMEAVLGMPVSELNAYLKAYRDALPQEEARLYIANALWLTEDPRFSAEPDFLQTIETHYGGELHRVAFDEKARRDINAWVEDNTKGMIREILEDITPEAVMYLINAIAFEAEWQEIYRESAIREGAFTTETGEARQVEFMHSQEHLYLEDENAVGFMKPYAGSDYAFVALLPREGLGVREYVESLTGEDLASLLSEPGQESVIAALPKFESRYSVELGSILRAMGMTDAFDPDNADFSGLGTSTAGSIFISRVLHKSFIAVDERGTKAGAATVVEMRDGCALMPEEQKEVILDRPFVYMIVDRQAKLPLFMGALMDVG